MYVIGCYVLIFFVSYIFYILIDYIFGGEIFPSYRIKQCNNGWKIQIRNFLVPFWYDYDMGDVAGFSFKTIEYKTKKDALTEMTKLAKASW